MKMNEKPSYFQYRQHTNSNILNAIVERLQKIFNFIEMPRTKARNAQNKRQRRNSENNIDEFIKELEFILEQAENKAILKWQQRRDQISGLFASYRSRIGTLGLQCTMDEMHNLTSPSRTVSTMSASTAFIRSPNDDGYVTESSNESSKTRRPKGVLASALAKSRLRSLSASNATINTSIATGRNISQSRPGTTTQQRASRSKYRTPFNRLQTMSADRALMNPVTPKIQMNTPISLLRYPKMGETIISMDGSPVIVNSGAMHNTANINIPIADGIFSMQPTHLSSIDSTVVARIDKNTLKQLKQLQENLAFVMNTVANWSK